MTFEITILLVLYQLKHFLADYPLQTAYMLGKFKEVGWKLPLSAHCLVHSLMTFAICLIFTDVTFTLMMVALDFSMHFLMDRLKASPNHLGRFKIEQKEFWWALGLDQMVHHLTHYFIIYLVVTH